jgi:hypothetical protein
MLRLVLNHEHQLYLACCVEEMSQHTESVLEEKGIMQEQVKRVQDKTSQSGAEREYFSPAC